MAADEAGAGGVGAPAGADAPTDGGAPVVSVARGIGQVFGPEPPGEEARAVRARPVG